jgi:hypothetical protein
MPRVKSLILFFLFFAIQQTLHAQGMIDTHYQLYTIRQEVQQINKDSLLKIKKLENEEFLGYSDRGNELNGYFKNDSIYKIRAWIGISNRIFLTEYYFKNEQLVFVYEQQTLFMDSDTSGKISFEGRYYFQDGRIIFSRSTGERSASPGNMSITDVLINETKDYMKKLKAKK